MGTENGELILLGNKYKFRYRKLLQNAFNNSNVEMY